VKCLEVEVCLKFLENSKRTVVLELRALKVENKWSYGAEEMARGPFWLL
jgi:hypothetical protein